MNRPRIAVTMGDPAGIGPEICLRLLADEKTLARCTPIVFGDMQILRRVAQRCDLVVPNQSIPHADWEAAGFPRFEAAAVLDVGPGLQEEVSPGHVSAATGTASVQYIDAAIDAALAVRVDAVVTGPIHKEAWHAAGIPYPGHTEMFAARTGAERICMMLTCDELTCSLVTTHVGIRDVADLLSRERVLEVIELSRQAMARIRNREPRLAVCGLNPHAGEGGMFGDHEEEKFIIPAIESARAAGAQIEGPFPPDTAFLPDRRSNIDCYVCMYHDQGLIPLKTLAFDEAVNVTLGLPIVRTSVDHGTALDIAWQGKAKVTSLIQAVQLAARLAVLPADR